MHEIFNWIVSHEALLGWLSIASVLMFVGSLMAIPSPSTFPPRFF